jgi:hypothetical protein
MADYPFTTEELTKYRASVADALRNVVTRTGPPGSVVVPGQFTKLLHDLECIDALLARMQSYDIGRIARVPDTDDGA